MNSYWQGKTENREKLFVNWARKWLGTENGFGNCAKLLLWENIRKAKVHEDWPRLKISKTRFSLLVRYKEDSASSFAIPKRP